MKFIVATDGATASDRALKQALTLAAATSSHITLITVAEPQTTYVSEVLMPTGDWVHLRSLPDLELEQKIVAAAEGVLNHAQALCQEAGVSCTTRLERGYARERLCAIADEEQSDLLVVGSRGLGGLERLLLGSVSDYVAHHATVPVLIVR
jgi:nucleotide-binding universal stress UspA family protein